MSAIDPIRVAITSIGSGVSQSIVHSCRLSQLPLKTFGVGTNPLAYGAFDCDYSDLLPSIYSDEYFDSLFDFCVKNEIRVLIPGLDDELLLLSLHESQLRNAGIVPVVSSQDVIALCRNKVKLGRTSTPIDRYFIKSYDKSEAIAAIQCGELTFPLFAKPYSGFASRGISILKDMNDVIHLDENKIIQPIIYPRSDDPCYEKFEKDIQKSYVTQISELSVQIVFGSQQNVLGVMATINKLKNGVPIEIIPCQNDSVRESINQIVTELRLLNHKGPINIQGRLTDQGPKFFEMNARFTGITGLRAMYGFNEVEAVIKDFLALECKNTILSFNSKRIGIRQVTDRLVDVTNRPIINKQFQSIKTVKRCLSTGITVLITGANGALGRELITELQKRDDIDRIIAVVRNPDKFVFANPNKITLLGVDALYGGCFTFGLIDCIFHLSFTRKSSNTPGLASSLSYTEFIMRNAILYQTGIVINVSSQSVYGVSRPPLWSECDAPQPETMYAQAKYAAELLTSNVKNSSRASKVVNIRLSTLTGPGYPESIMYKFGCTSYSGGEIRIVGGKQAMDILDVSDAAHALSKMLDQIDSEWQPLYNLGTGKSVSILDFAEDASTTARLSGYKGASIAIVNDKVHLATGMETGLFCRDFNWQQQCTIQDTYKKLFAHFQSSERSEPIVECAS